MGTKYAKKNNGKSRSGKNSVKYTKKTARKSADFQPINAERVYERVHIQGRWQLLTPMHIGSGFVTEKTFKNGSDSEETPEVACFCQDIHGNPYIPATALRGLFRQIVSRLNATDEKTLLESLLGKALPDNDDDAEQLDSESGKDAPDYHSRLRVYDARWEPKLSRSRITDPASHLPQISTHVVIDPLTRTAKPGLLFNKQEVPAGEEFECDIELDRVTHEELQCVVSLLQTLSGDSKLIRIGANANQLQGRLNWVFAEHTFSDGKSDHFVRVVKLETFSKWLQENLKNLKNSNRKFDSFYEWPAGIGFTRLSFKDDALELPVAIYPLSPILIPDVNLSKKCRSDTSKEDTEPDETGITGQRPKSLNSNDVAFETRLIIPGSSMLGAFRAQCRKILMTLAFETKIEEVDIKQILSLSAINNAVDSVMQRYFGSTAQRSKIWISEAVSNDAPQEHLQFFNAIDRFTGGAADGALFNTQAYTCEYLTFTLRLDSTLTEKSSGALALVAFALRDGVEGDIYFGGGTAHGYGKNHMVVLSTGEATGEELDDNVDVNENAKVLHKLNARKWEWPENRRRLTAHLKNHHLAKDISLTGDADTLILELKNALCEQAVYAKGETL